MPPEAASTEAAAALGAHALALWAATVVLVVGLVVLAWRARRRYRATHAASGSSTPAGVAWRVAAGFVVVVAAALLFAQLAEGARAGATIGRLDDAFALALRQATPEPVLQVASLVTHAGDPATQTLLGFVVALLLLGMQRRALAVGWVAAVLGNAILNRALKEIFARTRPLHEAMFVPEDGYSFPSGHTSGAVASYGMLAYVALRVLPPAWHLPALCTAAVLAVSTGFSRVFIGVHHASDVVAGSISGAAWLAVCIAAVELHRRHATAR